MLTVVRQCDLLGISRSGRYYMAKGEPAMNQILMREIDLAFTEWPSLVCARCGVICDCWAQRGHKRVRRLMRLMGLKRFTKNP